MLVVQNGRAQARCTIGHGVLRAALACISYIATLARAILNLSLIKAIALRILLCQLVDSLASNNGRLPGRHLRGAMLANYVGMDRLRAHTRNLRNLRAQSR